MTRIKVKSRIGPDGVLRVAVPVGPADADREVELTIEPTTSGVADENYQEFIRSTAGAWEGEFEQFPQGGLRAARSADMKYMLDANAWIGHLRQASRPR